MGRTAETKLQQRSLLERLGLEVSRAAAAQEDSAHSLLRALAARSERRVVTRKQGAAEVDGLKAENNRGWLLVSKEQGSLVSGDGQARL